MDSGTWDNGNQSEAVKFLKKVIYDMIHANVKDRDTIWTRIHHGKNMQYYHDT